MEIPWFSKCVRKGEKLVFFEVSLELSWYSGLFAGELQCCRMKVFLSSFLPLCAFLLSHLCFFLPGGATPHGIRHVMFMLPEDRPTPLRMCASQLPRVASVFFTQLRCP